MTSKRSQEIPNAAVRLLPRVDRLIGHPEVEVWHMLQGTAWTSAAARAVIDELRTELLAGGAPGESADALLVVAIDRLNRRGHRSSTSGIRAAINATGVILHTGLGRARLADAAANALQAVAEAHSLLEVDADSGERGSRVREVSSLLRELTGAEAGLAVNNNAAAVFLAVSALGAGREVIISRGQLVEIGGSFRIPDVIRQSGATLVEVGTTNRVRAADYEAAITDRTALILRVHPSNFRVVGFTEEPELAQLAQIAHERGLPLVDDLGSGSLIPLRQYGLADEPTVPESIGAGADLVTFSGDKLLGGPQAGLLAGKFVLIERLQRHPLMRVVRLDKLTLAALEATLRLYRDPARALEQIPTLAALTASTELLRKRAENLARTLAASGIDAVTEPGVSQVGGGSLPGEQLPTTLVSVAPRAESAAVLAHRLRSGTPSVWGRIRNDRLLLDLRTVNETELAALAARLREAVPSDG